MKSSELKVIRIGNSHGVRLPAVTLARYEIGDSLIMEETSEGILLRPQRPVTHKLSLAETAEQMADAHEDWSEWDATAADGLDQTAWNDKASRRVAEPARAYRRKPKG